MQRLREQHAPTDDGPLSIYVGSTPVAGWLPGFAEANALSVPGEPLINFWLGNRTTVSAHYDFPSNMACVVYGSDGLPCFPPTRLTISTSARWTERRRVSPSAWWTLRRRIFSNFQVPRRPGGLPGV